MHLVSVATIVEKGFVVNKVLKLIKIRTDKRPSLIANCVENFYVPQALFINMCMPTRE